MDDFIIVTNTGKLGDFMLCFPVASWLYKRYNKKIHWVITKNFPGAEQCDTLIMNQEMTGKLTYIDYDVNFSQYGGQPYKFDPNLFGVNCEKYYNFGYRGPPDKYACEFMAEEYNIGYDEDFCLNLGDDLPKTDKILCARNNIKDMIPQSEMIDLNLKVLDNLRILKSAKVAYCWKDAAGVALSLAKVPFVLFRPNKQTFDHKIFIKMDNVLNEVIVD